MNKSRFKRKRLAKKDRIALEARLIGRVLMDANYEDVREKVAGYGINWRSFYDKRHRALWRALETLNLPDTDGRMEIIEAEAYAAPAGANRIDYVAGEDAVRGEAGSAAAKAFTKKLIEESSDGVIWLGRELEAAGALNNVGGKKYLRALAETGEAEPLSPKSLISDLFGDGGR